MDILFCHKCADLKKIRNDEKFHYCSCRTSYGIIENNSLRVSESAVVFEINTNSLLRDVKRVLDGFEPIPGIVMQYKDESTFDRDIDLSEDDA